MKRQEQIFIPVSSVFLYAVVPFYTQLAPNIVVTCFVLSQLGNLIVDFKWLQLNQKNIVCHMPQILNS